MKSMFMKGFAIALAVALVVSFMTPTNIWAAKKTKFILAGSIYAGWMPWYYANQSGILKKWANKYGIQIEFRHMDYIPSVVAFVAKRADACVMTNMEALDMPAAAGVSTTVIILGDFSNGNDAGLGREGCETIQQWKGKEVYLVEFSVSHYSVVRILEENGMKESDIKIVNVSDSDIAPAFIANTSQKAVVTWNPLVMEILQEPGITKVFDSSEIPGEILDLCVVRTEVLEDNPDFAEALTGAWYEVMGIMSKRGSTADNAKESMAESAGCSLTEYKNQLKTTMMYYTPESAAEYMSSAEVRKNMDYVRNFCFKHNLLGENASSVDEVGIQYPDGTVQGDRNNIQFIFDASFMRKAAEGKLK